MNPSLVLAAVAAIFLSGCDTRIETAPAEKVTEKNTTIINPPAKEEKKVENKTFIVVPPGASKTEENKSPTSK